MKRLLRIFIIFLFIFLLGLWYADATSPYGKFSIVKPFFTTKILPNGQIQLHQERPIYFVSTPLIQTVTYQQRAFRTLENARFSEKPFFGTENQIIADIHRQRFDITKPYVISGAHFAEFYVRNFGMFYSAMLDPRFALSQEDWQLRQRVTLQTLATHLELLRQSGKEYTTFVPMWSNVFTGANWATDPSDSLFAVYYTLSATIHNHFISDTFPANISAVYKLQTQDAGNKLLYMYAPVLSNVTNAYLNNSIDPHTGIIKKSITLSSARDGIARESSFYDNVIAWSTAKMATDLGVQVTCPTILNNGHNGKCDFTTWKQKIIATFWDDTTGIFIDDLSKDSIAHHIYSGDAFIVTSTRFLDLTEEDDRQKLEREIAYVQKNRLDSPFPLRYAIHDQPEKLYFAVRYFAPSYMGESIWSHWGIEYAKSLLLLSQYDPTYHAQAKMVIDAYQKNIVRFGGYPELYDKYGNIFQTPFYKSILHTGWVINYEQAKMMLQ